MYRVMRTLKVQRESLISASNVLYLNEEKIVLNYNNYYFAFNFLSVDEKREIFIFEDEFIKLL